MSQAPDDSIISCAWFPDGQKYVCGGKKGQFYQVDLESNILESWEGVRVHGLHCLSDNRWVYLLICDIYFNHDLALFCTNNIWKLNFRSVLAADSHCRIRNYDFDSILDKEVLEEDQAIMTFT